jgi:WD40 repeat protein/serine/threonine protein kinase/two-component SAPR family response regulator
MNKITLHMLGPFQADLDGQAITDFRTRKVQALLIYLATENKAYQRELLLDLLWPGLPERSARSNLRQIVYYLRNLIPTTPDNGQPLIIANRQEILLNPEADIQADTAAFAALLEKSQSHSHLDLFLCSECRQDLEQAAALYRGDFLVDFYLDDSNEFEEWAQTQRQYFRRRVLDALSILTTIAIRQQDYSQAQAFARQQLDIDFLSENAYRQLMEALALSGRRQEALAVYESCRRVLHEELGMAPSAHTSEYFEKIQSGDLRFDAFPLPGLRGFELKEQIDEGVYGTIHRAVQTTIGREVAVKVIRRKFANDPEFIRRFEAEAQVIARLEHPYIVPLYDYWRDPHGAYLVMRYMRQGSLLAALQAGPWAADKTANMLDQVASALSIAHQHEVVHRDIKPGNILLDEASNAYLSDFGIAFDLTKGEPLTATSTSFIDLDYISPEQILGEPATPQSDIYSLGAVVYETLTGEKPFPNTAPASLLHHHLHEPLPPVTASRPDLPVSIDTVLQKATHKDPSQRYSNVQALAEAFRSAAQGLQPVSEARLTADLPTLVEVYNPYKGLRAFQEADAADFFGRETLVQQLLDRLEAPSNGRQSRFLALVGPSGSGKSSVIKAGLIPALRQGALPGSDKWFIAEMVPGSRPFEELELALWSIAVEPPPNLVEPMKRDTGGLLRTLRRILPATPGAQLLLVIDQFEELFTLVEDQELRTFFLDSLLTAIRAPLSPLRLVVTLRADFYDRPLAMQVWGEILKENTEIVLPLNPSELTWAVREPARRMGVSLEEGLASAIVADVSDQPGALPLLQYAMTELFEQREGDTITYAAYQGIGGVQGALGQRAESLYGELEQEAQQAARQLFLRLVTLGEGVEDTRRRTLRAELEALYAYGQPDGATSDSPTDDPPSPISPVIDLFGQHRLLSFDRDPLTRSPTVEVAHEALLREWTRLRNWLVESRHDVRMQRLLAGAAEEWQKAGQEAGYLLRGSRLDLFEQWAESSSVALTAGESSFLQASSTARQQRLAEEEMRHQRELHTAQKLARTQRQRATFLASALIIAIILTVVALSFARTANHNAQLATSRELALASINSLPTDPELSILLAFQALETSYTQVAEDALHRAIQQSRVRRAFPDVFRAAYHPDGTHLATTYESGLLKVWEIETYEELLSVSLPSEIYRLAYSPDGETIATGHDDGSVYLWDATTGAQKQALYGHTELVNWVTFSPDGKSLASHGAEGVAILWDLESGEPQLTFPGVVFWNMNVAFSPNSSLLAVVELSGGTVEENAVLNLWDTTTGAIVFSLPSSTEPTFSPDGAYLATNIANRQVIIWDLAASLANGSGQAATTLIGHTGFIIGIAFSPNGDYVATASQDGTAKVWDARSGLEQFSLTGHATHPRLVAFSPDGSHLLTVGGDGARIWDGSLPGNQEVMALSGPVRSGLLSIALSSDGSYLALGGINGVTHLHEAVSGELLAVLSGHSKGIFRLTFSPDNRHLATSGQDGMVKIWDVAGSLMTGLGQELLSFEAHDSSASIGGTFTGITGISYSPDGARLATSGADGRVGLWEATSGELLAEDIVRPDEAGIWDVAFSPDGHYLAASSEVPNAIVKVWRLVGHTFEELYTLSDDLPGGRIVTSRFSPDGALLLTGGEAGHLALWDAFSGELLRSLSGHITTVTNAVFSADGRTLASVSETELRIWDLASGANLLKITPNMKVYGVAFSPDGAYLYVSSWNGELQVYVLQMETLVSLAHSRLTRWFTLEECQRYLHLDACPPPPQLPNWHNR